MRNAVITVINAGDSSGDITSAGQNVNQVVSASFVANYTDVASAGTLKVQASNWKIESGQQATGIQPPAASWADVPNASSTVASGVGPAIVIGNMCFQWIRLVYTRSGGAGTATARMNTLSI
jgi:hypothetical protein